MIGKLELNFVSPELVTDSSMIGMLSSSIVDISSIFFDRLKHTYFRSTVVHQVCSQFEFIFSCLRNFELLQVLLLNTARKIFSSSTLASSPVKGLSGSVEWV
jgi:hypothetical protein